ncbi:MAG: ASKHA domain-containing protein [Desulfobacterales bacterium]
MSELENGWIKRISVTPPSIEDNTADADRLERALMAILKTEMVDIGLSVLSDLPELLRKSNYNLRCVLFKDHKKWRLYGISSDNTERLTGLAVDLGTTTVVLRLIDLSTGLALAESSFINPQISIGPDILTRLHFAEKENGLRELNRLIIEGLNRATAELCKSCEIEPSAIYLLSVAGNTSMTHLFLGLNPRWIIREPYIPVTNRPGCISASELGITANKSAGVFIFPNTGSYFGGDLVAGILYSGLSRGENTSILVDIGTNAEVVIGNKNWLVACAGAAGPALEGGVTKMGMMAGPGVIDKVFMDSETGLFSIHTIEELPPIGICGSGVIDLAAALFLSGMIDIRGKFVPVACKGRLKEKDGLKHFVLVPANESPRGNDLSISQADIDSLIRSKAAMYTILETISSYVGISLSELSTFYVAGTFGSLINPRSAIIIGMIPDLPEGAYKSIGNSSLEGASMLLKNCGLIDEIDAIRNSITYIELNVNQDFMNRFSAARFIPHTNLSLFPSVNFDALV